MIKSTLTIAALAASAVLWGCASHPTDTKPAVEDRTAGVIQPPPAADNTNRLQPNDVNARNVDTGDDRRALKDPNNILSKRSIFYDYDSDAIKPDYQPLVQAHGRYLSTHRNAKVLVQGNSDERGSREYNIALGQRRAESAKRALVLSGAQESQVEAVSLGKEKPRCTESNDSCWAQNRRSDILYDGEY